MAKARKAAGASGSTRPAKKKAAKRRPKKKPAARKKKARKKKTRATDLHKLTRADAAAILEVPIEQIERDLEEGAPTGARGRIDLVRYTSWLLWRVIGE